MHHVACADEKMPPFASVHAGSASKTFVPWSVVALEQSQTFEDLFRNVQNGRFTIIKPSTELSETVYLKFIFECINNQQLHNGD